MVMLKNIWASKVVSIRTKLRICNSNVKSVLLFGPTKSAKVLALPDLKLGKRELQRRRELQKRRLAKELQGKQLLRPVQEKRSPTAHTKLIYNPRSKL
nr:hypothetical protein BaRGS_002581 [Batillaria attramentaria]